MGSLLPFGKALSVAASRFLTAGASAARRERRETLAWPRADDRRAAQAPEEELRTVSSSRKVAIHRPRPQTIDDASRHSRHTELAGPAIPRVVPRKMLRTVPSIRDGRFPSTTHR